MKLFRELIESAPVRTKLPFGIVGNVRIVSIDTGDRKSEGLRVKQNVYITIAQFDAESDKILSQNEGAYWDLDPTRETLVMNNFVSQFTSLLQLIRCYKGDEKSFDEEIVSVCPKGIKIDDFIVTKEGAKVLQEALAEAVTKYIIPHIGNKSTLLRCKSTVNKKGYFELGKEDGWIVPMDSKEKVSRVTPLERKIYRDSLNAGSTKKARPDMVGEKTVSTSTQFEFE